MIQLDHRHWQKLNRMAVEIHSAGSRDELVTLVAESLPITLSAEEACWCEHGPAASMDRICSSICCQDEILALVLTSNGHSHSLTASSQNGFANDGVFDVDSVISESRRPEMSECEGNDQASRARHQIATQFYVYDHRGVLLTVRNSSPFTAVQKFTLSLLREHLAIAARRHYYQAVNPVIIHPVPADSVLSRREKEVLPYLVKGFTNPEIANSLGISPRTVEKHVASILDKSGLDNRRMLIGHNSFSTTGTTPAKNG